jgi:CHAT domain-containing protein/tetratricopeptide repeat protein
VTERADLLMSLTARLQRATSARDPAPILDPVALEAARRLAELIRDDDDADVAALHTLGWFHWYRYQALPSGVNRPDLEAAIQLLTPCFLLGTPNLPEALRPMLADKAEPPAHAMLRSAHDSPDARLIAGALDLWQRIVAATPVRHPGRVNRVANLGNAFRIKYDRTGQLSDLDSSIRALQEAVAALPAGHPYRSPVLSNLGGSLLAKFERTGALSDLDAAIRTAREAVDTSAPDDPGRGGRLSNLGNALRTRFDRTGAAADLDEAIQRGREAVAAAPEGQPQRAGFVANLGTALGARFELTGASGDLDEAIAAAQAAVAASPAGHADEPTLLSSLAHVLQSRFGLTGAQADLDAAIRAQRQATEAVPAGHPDRAAHLSNLGELLGLRYDRGGADADLDAAIRALREALETAPSDDPDRGGYLINLGSWLRGRYERTGAPADLDEAVETAQAAVTATPGDHPQLPARWAGLAIALQARFGRTGALADIDAAIEASRAAVDRMPRGHIDRAGMLANLADALRIRFERTSAAADIDAAVEAGRAAVDGTPSRRPDRRAALSALGGALAARFFMSGDIADVDAAIGALREAVAAIPEDHARRGILLSNLSWVLRARYERNGEPADLDDAIDCQQRAVAALAPGGRPLALFSLGSELADRYQRNQRPADRDAAVAALVAAAEDESASPSIRIRAAKTAAPLLVESGPERAAGLLEAAVRLLTVVTPRQLERGDQQYALSYFARLASDAAALILASTGSGGTAEQRAARALQVLESGRAVLLSQALDTRSDLTELQQRHPELAERFVSLRDRLDEPGAAGPASWTPAPGAPASAPGPAARDRRAPDWQAPDWQARDRHRLAAEFAAVITRIRDQAGFASFGLPPALDELLGEAAAGPVVAFNVSPYGSGALLLTGDGIRPLSLPGLAYDTVIRQVNSFHQARRIAVDPATSASDRVGAQRTMLEILGWLWDAAAGPVLDALRYRRPPSAGAEWPRVWWVPGGPLSLLPLHAAGHHSEPPAAGQARRTVLDRVTSSYTPTIRALRYARQNARRAPAPASRALIVAMPVTPGLPGGGELANVPQEVARVRALLDDTVLLAEPDPAGVPLSGSFAVPTRANVFDQLPTHPIAHFACHGYSDPADPSTSRLLLHDHDRFPMTVASLAPMDLGQAQLAYLSACETALTSAADLIDEAINLTTAFQLAGFPHVIGTLWEISDSVAVEVAGSFYAGLHGPSGALDTSRAALALHDAVRAVRDSRPRAPSLWAAYLHAGA